MRLMVSATLACATVLPNVGHAVELSWGAFGTVGVAHSNNDLTEYMPAGFHPEGVGTSHEWNYDLDTVLGAQLSVTLIDKLSAVVQVVSEQNFEDKYTPRLEWANIKYAFTPNLNLRVGRIALGSFLTSDSRKVGYTIPWVRVPVDVYRLLPITNSDGVDASYKHSFGSVSNTVQLMYGKNLEKIGSMGGVDMTGDATDIKGVFDTVEWNSLTFHFAYHQFDLSIAKGPKEKMKFSTVGLSYDPGSWFAMSEYARKQQGTSIDEGYYISGGYRFDNFTPYATYARSQPVVVGGMGGSDTKTNSVGLRWDVLSNTAIKAQYDAVNNTGSKSGITSIDVNFLF